MFFSTVDVLLFKKSEKVIRKNPFLCLTSLFASVVAMIV